MKRVLVLFSAAVALAMMVIPSAVAALAADTSVGAKGGKQMPPAPALYFSPHTAYSYGTVDVGSGPSHDFTLTNNGATSTALVVSLTGAAFSVTADSCSGVSLPFGRSCVVTVLYSPTTESGDSGTLTATGKGKKPVAPIVDSVALNGTGHLVGNGTTMFFRVGADIEPGVETIASPSACGSVANTNFDFTNLEGSPVGSCPRYDVSGYASGYFRAPADGVVDFYSTTDDAFYLTIGGSEVISRWFPQAATPWQGHGQITMTEGEFYPFQLWWNQDWEAAVLRLAWVYLGQSLEIVPVANIFEALPSP